MKISYLLTGQHIANSGEAQLKQRTLIVSHEGPRRAEDVALELEAHALYSKTKEDCGQDNPIEEEDDFESYNVGGVVDSRGRETDEPLDRVEAFETEEGDIDMATCLDSSSSRRRDFQSFQGKVEEMRKKQ